MRRAISLLAVTTVSLNSFSFAVFAQESTTSTETNNIVETTTTTGTALNSATTTTDDVATATTDVAAKAENVTLNAAPNSNAVTATSINAGEYTEVACSSDPIFGQNSCGQCFVGRGVKVGERLTGLADNWKNTTSNYLIAVRDEQKTPNMVSYDSVWTPSSADESKMWKNSSAITWIPGTSGKDEFQLLPDQKVTFMETDLGAGFTLTSSQKKHGETVGLLRFPVVYYTMDMTTVTRSATAETHYECVKYTLDNPTTPTTPPVVPKTEVETGPTETLILIIAAFFIAFGLMISLRKRS